MDTVKVGRAGGYQPGMESVYHRESVRMNTYLTCQMTERDGIREALEKAEPLSIPGIIGIPEIVKNEAARFGVYV